MLKKILIVLMVCLALSGMGYLGYLSLQLKDERDLLAEDLKSSQSRSDLLNQKYKEQKALVSRMQRQTLTLEGQVRQAKLDIEVVQKKNVRLAAHIKEVEGTCKATSSTCEKEKVVLEQTIKTLAVTHDQLKQRHEQTTALLKKTEAAKANLENDLQSTESDLEQALSKNKRYLSHNTELSRISKTLIARIEKNELGSSILVKEPLIQFKRVEIEKLLQEYLDQIDKQKIYH